MFHTLPWVKFLKSWQKNTSYASGKCKTAIITIVCFSSVWSMFLPVLKLYDFLLVAQFLCEHTCNYLAQEELQVSCLVFSSASVVLIMPGSSHDAVSCGWQIVLLRPLCANNEEAKFRYEEQAESPGTLTDFIRLNLSHPKSLQCSEFVYSSASALCFSFEFCA